MDGVCTRGERARPFPINRGKGVIFFFGSKTELDHFTKNMDDGEGVSRPIMGNFHMFIFII